MLNNISNYTITNVIHTDKNDRINLIITNSGAPADSRYKEITITEVKRYGSIIGPIIGPILQFLGYALSYVKDNKTYYYNKKSYEKHLNEAVKQIDSEITKISSQVFLVPTQETNPSSIPEESSDNESNPSSIPEEKIQEMSRSDNESNAPLTQKEKDRIRLKEVIRKENNGDNISLEDRLFMMKNMQFIGITNDKKLFLR